MSVNKMPYSGEKLGLLKQLLVNSAESGKPIDYEIRVDGMKAVSRTNDIEQFDRHEDFIGADTLSVTILIYDGASRNNTKHIFILKEEPKPEPKNKPLSGIEIDKLVSAKVGEVKRQMKEEELKKENKELQATLDEAYETITVLKEIIADKDKKNGLDSINWGKFAGGALEQMVRNNPHIVARIPGGEALAGIILQDNIRKEQSQEEPLGETTFTSLDESNTLTKEQERYLDVLENFKEEQLDEVMAVLEIFTENPRVIAPTKSFTEQYVEKLAGKKKEATRGSQTYQESPKAKAEKTKAGEQNTPSNNISGNTTEMPIAC